MNSIDRISNVIADKFKDKKQILSFEQYLEEVRENPLLHMRTAAEYLKDCFDHFGSYETRSISSSIRRWRLFDIKFPGLSAIVQGQEEAQNKIYSHVSAFTKRGKSDKILMLHGPNGTAKTSIINSIMFALEDYSKKEPGAIYTFNWVFSDNHEKGGLGFGKATVSSGSLAHEDPEKLSFKIRSGLRDNPLLLIPTDQRRTLLRSFFEAKDLPFNENHPIFEQELSHKFQEIYNELFENYKGDWKRVLQHVQVCRVFISKRYRSCAVTIEPQRNVDAQSKALTLDRDFEVPVSLKRANLHEAYGDLIDGNRGVIEYSDFFKRPLELNKYLLTTSEQGTVSLSSTNAFLDLVFFATANEKYMNSFKNDPDYASFKGRIEFIRVPYLRQWPKEAAIYKDKIESLARGKHVSPFTADFIGLWAVLTRLKKPSSSSYKDHSGIATSLTAVKKANLYAFGECPEDWDDKQKKILISMLPSIAAEFDNKAGSNGINYEGRTGASAREIMSMINEASLNKEFKCLSSLAMMNEVRELNKDITVHEYLSDTKDGYGNPAEILAEAEKELVRWFNNQLQVSIDVVSSDEYERVFDVYISNVSAWKKGIKIRNRQTGNMEDPDEKLMRETEEKFSISGGYGSFRENLIMRIANHAIETGDSSKIDYKAIFSDLFKKLRDASYEERKKNIDRIKSNMLKYNHKDWSFLSKDEQEEVQNAVQSMVNKGWCEHCLKEMLSHVR